MKEGNDFIDHQGERNSEEVDFYLKIEELDRKAENNELSGSDIGLIYDLIDSLLEKLKGDQSLSFDDEFRKGLSSALGLLNKGLENLKKQFKDINPNLIPTLDIEIKTEKEASQEEVNIQFWDWEKIPRLQAMTSVFTGV